jgi:hypothetical protein
MRELKVKVQLNDEDKIVFMQPVCRATGKTVDIVVMTARLLTQEDIDREIKELMEEGRTYRKVGRRIRELR